MIMKMENGMQYVAPEVEVLEMTVEMGFAGSGGSTIDPGMPDIEEP